MSHKYHIGDIIGWNTDDTSAEIVGIKDDKYAYKFIRHSESKWVNQLAHFHCGFLETVTFLLKRKIDVAKIYREILNEI